MTVWTNHDVAVGLAGDVGGDGAEESAGEGVDATVADDEEVGVGFVNDAHEGFDGGAGADGGLDGGGRPMARACSVALSRFSWAGSVPRTVTESWRRVLEASSLVS